MFAATKKVFSSMNNICTILDEGTGYAADRAVYYRQMANQRDKVLDKPRIQAAEQNASEQLKDLLS